MLECEGQPNVYFASDGRGLGMQDGESMLCGGGTGFPPQVGTRIREKSEAEQYLSEYPTTAVMIDGKEVQKLTYTDTEGLHPGMETTLYLTDMGDSYLEFAYNKPPDSENYDASEASRDKFTTMIEETVRFIR